MITKFPLKFLTIFICLYLEWMTVIGQQQEVSPMQISRMEYTTLIAIKSSVCMWVTEVGFSGDQTGLVVMHDLCISLSVLLMEVWGEGTIRLVTCATLEISALTRPVVTRDTMEQGCWCIRIRSYARLTWTLWLRQDNWSICFGVGTRDVSFSFTCFAVHDIPQVKLGWVCSCASPAVLLSN